MKIDPKTNKLSPGDREIIQLLDKAKSCEADNRYKEACRLYAQALDRIYQKRDQAEADLRAVFNTMQDVFYRADTEGKVVALSPSAANLLGYESADELIGRDIKEFYKNIDDRASFLEAIMVEGKVTDYEIELKKKDGRIITGSVSSHYYYDESGNWAGIEGICRDITDRKKAEKTLRSREAELRAIFENSAAGITVSDLHGKVLQTNPKHQKMFGYDSNELSTMLFSDFTHTDDVGKHQASYKQLIAGEIDHFNMQKRFIHKTGRVIPGLRIPCPG